MDDDQFLPDDAPGIEHSPPTLRVVRAPEVGLDTRPVDSAANQPFAPNPMVIEFAPVATATVDAEAIDAFDPQRHNDLLDRLEHELALVDAALTHIDDDDLGAAETAIKELARHHDDGQVALQLR
ncbi:MAG: hypothetical protein V3V01_11560 [Acidimicrobiales bacterium]